MPNLHDHGTLEKLRQKQIIITSGTGDYEDPSQSAKLARDLWAKGVNANLDLWGRDMRHDWPTWRKMLPYFLESKF
jgi:esterase/lipase superfamily enzyme